MNRDSESSSGKNVSLASRLHCVTARQKKSRKD